MFKIALVTLVVLATISHVQAQSKHVNLDDDDDIRLNDNLATLTPEKLKKGSQAPKQKAPEVFIRKAYKLEYRFEDSAEWTTRGEVIVGKDASGKIVQAEVENGNV